MTFCKCFIFSGSQSPAFSMIAFNIIGFNAFFFGILCKLLDSPGLIGIQLILQGVTKKKSGVIKSGEHGGQLNSEFCEIICSS